VSVAQGNVQIARTKLDAAKQALADVQAGPDQTTLDQAQATLDNAMLSQQNAEDRLAEVMAHPTPQELRAAEDQLNAAQSAVDRANAVGRSAGSTSSTNVSSSYNIVLLEKDVARTQALIDSLQQDLAASVLNAPFAGIVTKVDAKAGDKLAKGAAVVTLAKRDQSIVRLELTSSEASKVAIGQPATIKFDGLDVSFAATVDRIGDASKGQSGRIVQLSALSSADWQAAAPMYGTLAQVQVQVNQKKDVLVVPKKAVHTAGQRRYVQVQAGGGRKIVNVDVGIISSDSAEILSGLTEGQTVYVGP
jgi:multidrug efflux pump subunit AcrA (membrane-fusion protein)